MIYECLRKLPIPMLDKQRLQSRLDEQLSMQKAFSKEYNLTDALHDFIQDRLERQQANVYLDVYGLTGTAKTYGSLYLCAKHMPGFTNEQIFFGAREILQGISMLKPKTLILNDDKTRDFGMGTSRRLSEYMNIIQVVRKYQISLINTATSPRLFALAHYMLESLYIDRERRVSRFAVQTCSSGGMDRMGITTLGYAEFPHPDTVLPPEAITEYERRKDIFIEQNLRKKGSDDIDTAAREVIESPEFQVLEQQYLRTKQRKIPKKVIIELVATKYNYLNRNNEVHQIADRISIIGLLERQWRAGADAKD